MSAQSGGAPTSLYPSDPGEQTDGTLYSTGTTNSNGNVDLGSVIGATYGANSICATISGAQVCLATPLTMSGDTNVIIQEEPPVPPAPTNLSALTSTNQSPALAWTTVSEATSYNIYRNGTDIGSTTTPSYIDTSAPQGTNTYYVTAVNAGGESSPSNTITIIYDTTLPTITYSVSPQPNTNGWNDSSVVVTFTCSDPAPGITITSCSSPVTLSSNGTNQIITGTASDSAGNAAAVTTSPINIDQGLPTVSTPTLSTNPIVAGNGTTLTAIPSPSASDLSPIVGGEYYIGITDPGKGNGTSMTYNSDSNTLATIFGSTLASGTYQINVRAENAAGNWSNTTSATLTVNPATVAPTITSASSASTGMRVPFSFTVTTTGTPSVSSVTESGTLPSGITFTNNNNGTATISGTATVGTNGAYPITITASSGVTPNAVQHFILTVTTTTSKPIITSANTVAVTFGQAMTPFTVTTTGYSAPSLSETTPLPSGLTFHDNHNGTATISGTPSGNAEGVYTITITARNSVGMTTQTFTVTVNRTLTITSAANAVAITGLPFSFQVTSTGYPAPTYSLSGTLPTGLNFNSTTGVISGTAQVSSLGIYPLTITATNSQETTSQSFRLTVL